jgi:tetratricopeptide (TPR) repeat protein
LLFEVVMTANGQTVAPTTEAGAVEQAGAIGIGSRWLRTAALVLGTLILLFAGTYAFAWFRASSLSASFMADADRSYQAGQYLQAMTGYEEFDPARNTYVTRGGYASVARIWADDRAWPRPAVVEEAEGRVDEILNQRLTIADAEGFVQANIGRRNPYLGIVYLRLGELYAAEGDADSAREIFEEFPSLFPNEPELIERAQQNLAQLGG